MRFCEDGLLGCGGSRFEGGGGSECQGGSGLLSDPGTPGSWVLTKGFTLNTLRFAYWISSGVQGFIH